MTAIKRRRAANEDAPDPSFIRNRILDMRYIRASELVPSSRNIHQHGPEQKRLLTSLISSLGFVGAELTRTLPDGRLELIDGHLRQEIAGDAEIPVLITDLTEDEADQILATYDPIQRLATYDQDNVASLTAMLERSNSDAAALLRAASQQDAGLDLIRQFEEQQRILLGTPWSPGGDEDDNPDALDDDGADGDERPDNQSLDTPPEDHASSLVARFGVPPFTVLDTRQGYWQERKRAWLALGVEGELGRDVAGENIRFGANSAMKRVMVGEQKDFAAGEGNEAPALSIFDPVLAEMACRWFCPQGGVILDPFAGGSVRGVVAARTGRSYVGIDLRSEQVAANEAQWQRIGLRSAQETLAAWMRRVYAVCVDEETLSTRIGETVWPEEMSEYLELLCLTYANAPITLRVAPHLIQDERETKPFRPKTCLLLFSGGKDSTAAGVLAARHGYQIHAVYVQRVNNAYPHEHEHAQRVAALMGWEFTIIDPGLLPRPSQEALCKNQFLWAQVVASLDYLPGRIAFGSYLIDDCEMSPWFNDYEVAFRSFETAYRAAWGSESQRVPLLHDPRQAISIWRTIPEEAQQLVSSCMLPARYKPQHRARSLAAGVPLYEYECGACEKCYERALICASLGDADRYPAAYLAKAKRRVTELCTQPLWSHGHPRLRSPEMESEPGATSRYLLSECYQIDAEPRTNDYPAVPVDVERHEDGASSSEPHHSPRWIVGDSRELAELTRDAPTVDFLFTCPPYVDLERYSDDPRDLSNAPDYPAFLEAYRSIIAQAVDKLAPNRFAAIVVGDVRDADGYLYPFVTDTIHAFGDAGMRPYNDAVVVTPAGTLPLRAGRTFTLSRKFGRTHQRLLIFVKGDPKLATEAVGDVDLGEFATETDEEMAS